MVEIGITLDYLKNLYNAYQDFLNEISRMIPVIRVDYEEFRDVDDMVLAIVSEYKKICNITDISFIKKINFYY